MADLRVISGPVREVAGRVILGRFWGQFWVNLGSILDPYLRNLIKTLHLAVGRASRLNID